MSNLSQSDEPLTLHRHEVDGRLGGAAYAHPFARYLSLALASVFAVENLQDRRWWLNAYVATRVRQHMATYRDGELAYQAILLYERDGADFLDVADAIGHTDGWLTRMSDRLHKQVRSYRYGRYHRAEPFAEQSA